MNLLDAAANVWDKTVTGHVANLHRMPREAVVGSPSGILYRYLPRSGVDQIGGPPVLLVPPLGAPDFAYDLRRGCSLVQHLLLAGRTVYLVDYGPMSFDDRGLGIENWVDDVVPRMTREVAAETGEDVDLVAWSLGGIFALLAVAAAAEDSAAQDGAAAHDGTRGGVGPLPVNTVTVIATPVDITKVPLIAPIRPLAQIAGGRVVSSIYQAIGSFPAPMVSWAFHLTAVDRLITRPLALLSRLDDRDCLAQIEAVDHMMANMHGYPGRAFGQLFHLLVRGNDLSSGALTLGGRTIALSALDVPVLVVAGEDDVIAPLKSVRRTVELLTGSPEVRYATAPGGHLGVLTGRRARDTTWLELDRMLDDHATPTGAKASSGA
ncbi:MAG: alpha/beta fold hydrolase [Pseudonocardia sp.]|nr:alpha/beta fold hydrolase [Pseudonocardia sp.]